MNNKKIQFKKSLNYMVGIDIPIHIKEEINDFINKELKEFSPIIKWINKFEYHMTIAYIGQITQEQLDRLKIVSDQILCPPFTISVQGLCFFPPGKKPKYLRIGIKTGREKIKILAEKIRSNIANKAGLIPKNNFYPFITIGNINCDQDKIIKEKLFNFIYHNWDFPFGQFKIDNFHLYRITKNGYVHNHQVNLKNGPIQLWESE